MTPRAVRPVLASMCAAGLSDGRLALRVTPVMDVECMPVSTSRTREETSGPVALTRLAAKLSASGAMRSDATSGHSVRLPDVAAAQAEAYRSAGRDVLCLVRGYAR